ncbi:hypothetical protein BN2475_250066 [Paraburkholderia ribeironis]|uniref:Uncharacterized protein n=1 Tax=Paraburkholderia ribeironis TaxID=1247936 RepID=A0A1N7RYK9_9BURK|nr:hypothetical protein BN2475_250066 [Paraburkholderia ribeironis]
MAIPVSQLASLNWRIELALTNQRRQSRVTRFTVVAFPAATFADFCAIFHFSRPLPGLHDARL